MTVGVRAKRSRQAEKKIKLKEIFRRAKLIKPIVFVSLESKAQQMKWSYSHRDSFVWTSLDCVEKKLSVCARRSTRLLDHSSLDSSFLSARSDSMNLTCVLSYSDVRFNKETKTDLYRTIFFYVEQTTNEQQISMCRLEKERTETDRRSLMFFSSFLVFLFLSARFFLLPLAESFRSIYVENDFHHFLTRRNKAIVFSCPERISAISLASKRNVSFSHWFIFLYLLTPAERCNSSSKRKTRVN